jgi:SAM-dependent methyltransferase
MTTEDLFDLSDEYEAMLNQGIGLSGENMTFFQEGRLRLLQERTLPYTPIRRILDFGCGLGNTSRRLSEIFPGSQVTGADTSTKILEAARIRNGGAAVHFSTVGDLESNPGGYDLCYVNGVFHHIAPQERPSAFALIHSLLRQGGMLGLFENNPWNPGARMVMARIPFDRDAQMISPAASARLLRQSRFNVLRVESLFFFPRLLSALRPAEPFLGWTRLGAQYLILAAR